MALSLSARLAQRIGCCQGNRDSGRHSDHCVRFGSDAELADLRIRRALAGCTLGDRRDLARPDSLDRDLQCDHNVAARITAALHAWNVPDDDGWTGAEIKECCRKSYRLR